MAIFLPGESDGFISSETEDEEDVIMPTPYNGIRTLSLATIHNPDSSEVVVNVGKYILPADREGQLTVVDRPMRKMYDVSIPADGTLEIRNVVISVGKELRVWLNTEITDETKQPRFTSSWSDYAQ